MEDPLIRRLKGANNDHYTLVDYVVNGVVQTTKSRLLISNNWSLSGFDVPSFHAKVRRGDLIPMTPYNLIRRYGEADGDYYIVDRVNNVATLSPCISYDMWNVTDEEITAYLQPVNDYLVQKAAAKIYNEGYDFLTFLGELGETKHMLKQCLKHLISLDLPKWILKHPKYSPWKRLKDMSNDWLAVRYGWRPFFMDLEDLNALVANLNSEFGKVKRHSRHANDVLSFENVTETSSSSQFGPWSHVVTDSVEVQMRGSVTADVAILPVHLNPMVTAWQLTKLSFVIDWLWNVSQALEAASFLAMQHAYTASFGQRVKVKRSYRGDMVPPYTSAYKSGYEYEQGTCEATLDQRVPRKIPLFPQIALRLNAFKVIDLWALVQQRLRVKRR